MLSKRKKLILAGGGDFTTEVIWLISEIPSETRDWDLVGIIDDTESSPIRLKKEGIDVPVLGTISDHAVGADEVFCVCIGRPKGKLKVAAVLASKGARFVSLVHPSAGIGPSSKIGNGVILCRNAVVTMSVNLGDHVHLNIAASVGHHAVLGEGCTLSGHCDVTGHAVLGKGVFLGSHASVAPGVKIGDFATVGAGSVAFRNVAAEQTVVGVPAKTLIF